MTPLLEVDDLDVAYGRLRVLFGVSIEVGEGERCALLGTNGAGKSTLLRAISGVATVQSGRIRFQGNDITRLDPVRRVSLGLGHVSGGRSTFPSLTVRENLLMGAYPVLRDRPLVDARLAEALDRFPALGRRLDQKAGTLSGGEQQLMALGRAMLSRPKLLIIDELSLGLAPAVMQEILQLVDALAELGTAMLVVEQSLNVALALAERAYFMEKGEIRFSGPTAELVDRGDIVRSVFFGAEGAAAS